MRYLIVIAAVALAGCGDRERPEPGVKVEVVERVVEVQRPCPVTRPKRPEPLAQPLPTNSVALAAVLALKLNEYAGPGAYADRADAAIETCKRPAP